MIEGFQNPGLAIGAALCAVPLIIHLLNRQRHRPQEWAAMRFVLAAYRKTRRRVQLENLLLLLARMLAVAALAFAVARPAASGDSLAGLREERADLAAGAGRLRPWDWRRGQDRPRGDDRARDGLIEDLDGPAAIGSQWLAGARPRAFPDRPRGRSRDPDTLDRPLDEDCDLAAAFGVVADALEDDPTWACSARWTCG